MYIFIEYFLIENYKNNIFYIFIFHINTLKLKNTSKNINLIFFQIKDSLENT